MTASCITSCVILLLCSHLPEVSTGCPLDKFITDIDALNQTVRMLQNRKEEVQQSIKALNAKMLKCLTPPLIEGANIALEKEDNGDFKATYSCRQGYTKIGGSKLISYCSNGVWSLMDLKCTDYTDCYGLRDGRAVYLGKMDRTAKGSKCHYWFDKFGESFPYGDIEEDTYTAGNYCRDPLTDGNLWCYTDDYKWDYCSVPSCLGLQQ